MTDLLPLRGAARAGAAVAARTPTLPPPPENPEGVPPSIDDPRPPGSPGPVREPPRPPMVGAAA